MVFEFHRKAKGKIQKAVIQRVKKSFHGFSNSRVLQWKVEGIIWKLDGMNQLKFGFLIPEFRNGVQKDKIRKEKSWINYSVKNDVPIPKF